MARTFAWVLVALALMATGAPAAAKGLASLQFWGAGGYHRAFTLADNGLDLRGGADVKLGFIGVGLSGRWGTDRLDGEGVTRGAAYLDLVLYIPLPVVVPYLRLGAGVCGIYPEIRNTQTMRLGLHQGIGADILIPKHGAIGLMVDVDENLNRETGHTEVGTTASVVFKLRL